jgi:sulfate permease, SulP family
MNVCICNSLTFAPSIQRLTAMSGQILQNIQKVFHPKILTTLKDYNSKTFLSDLIAGLIVGVVALPLAIAFGIASGVAPEQGLITAVIAGFLISLLGGSRVQIGGPTGAFIVIVYGIVEQFGVPGLIVATIMAGFMLVAMGVLQLGSIIKFMPHPIVVGFTSGIAVVIFSSQIKDFFGLEVSEATPADFIAKWRFYLVHFKTINIYAAGLGLFTVITIMLWPKIEKRIPGTLIALVITTIVTTIFDLPVETIGSRFGEIKATIPCHRSLLFHSTPCVCYLLLPSQLQFLELSNHCYQQWLLMVQQEAGIGLILN